MPGERTEQATQHRRDKAREDGDILHRRELTAAAGTLAGVIALGMLSSHVLQGWRAVFASFLELGRASHWEPSEIGPTLATVRRLSLAVLGPVGAMMAAVAGAALSAGIIQTGGIRCRIR